MNAPVPFEKHRFRSAAEHYRKGRPPYALPLFDRVAERVGLTRAHAVLDLGCGPGQLAQGFARFAGAVTAIDPEPEMLRIAAADAAEAGLAIRFIEGSSYDIGPALGGFRLAAIGRAFHWMDRADTLRRLEGMIETGGALALFGDRHPEMHENAWRAVYDAVLDKYSAEDPARRQRKGADWIQHESVLLASPFPRLERIGVIESRRTPVANIEDRLLSLSSVSRDKIGARADEMISELNEKLAPFVSNGEITEIVESQALIAMRPPR
ncbi:class I SAM-dependent methyltransferase [Dongia sp.]|uniref:class I SAM-dependent methyltransferase n=1 Tax=Dongia sp. TaxID=1977262 RepID=UPI0037503450